jgi:REP element-mobilizing transposase RayT
MSSDERYLDKYRIATARVQWHDYDGGDYFITICTHNHSYFFGNIDNDEMHLSPVGRIAEESLKKVSTHHPYAEIPLFVVMPNHIHLILRINMRMVQREYSNMKQSPMAVVVGSMKSSISRKAKVVNPAFAWQTRFYDHIIRDNKEALMITDYIKENVVRWQYDKLRV